MNQGERRLFLIDWLLRERGESIPVPDDKDGQWRLLRALLNVRPPMDAPEEFLKAQDEFLREETRRKGITDVSLFDDGMTVWQGDITTLRCDAIVNAANSGLTGCYVPNHGCIDNAIHTYAGVELRLECAAFGGNERPGRARITPAFNLPSKYVIHTVGPIVRGRVTGRDRFLLGKCYSTSLALAAENGLESIALCCISTGEFHFPHEEAAVIAVSTVKEFLGKGSSLRKVVFNVFKDEDREIYKGLV